MSATAAILVYPERRWRNNVAHEDGETAEARRPFALSQLQLLLALTALVTIVVGLNTFIYVTIVDTKLTAFELRLHDRYASRDETMPRREYEIRHAELIQSEGQQVDRLNKLEDRVQRLELLRLSEPAKR